MIRLRSIDIYPCTLISRHLVLSIPLTTALEGFAGFQPSYAQNIHENAIDEISFDTADATTYTYNQSYVNCPACH